MKIIDKMFKYCATCQFWAGTRKLKNKSIEYDPNSKAQCISPRYKTSNKTFPGNHGGCVTYQQWSVLS